MLLRLLVLFVVVPLIELVLLLQLAEWTDWWFALAVVIVTGVTGTMLARVQGFRTLQRIRLELAAGRLPTEALLDTAMIFIAGALLLTPGLLTDAFGLSLLIPFCRRWYRQRVAAWIRRHFQVYTAAAADGSSRRSRIVDSYVVDAVPPDPDERDRP